MARNIENHTRAEKLFVAFVEIMADVSGAWEIECINFQKKMKKHLTN
jgi:hypothetical protein